MANSSTADGWDTSSNSSSIGWDDSSSVNSPDQRPTMIALAIFFPILAIAFTAARFHARKVKSVGFGSDDWTCLAALIFCIGVCINIILSAILGNVGWHITFDLWGFPVDYDTYLAFYRTTSALEILVWPAVGLTKISVLLLYKRIFGINTVFRTLVWVLIGFVVAWMIAFTLALTFSCLPVQSQWDPTLDSTCVDQDLLFTMALATDVITDGLILLLPAYNVWKLQMPITRKISIIGIFMLGGLVTVTGIIRIHYLTLLYDDLNNPSFYDITYSFAPIFYWSSVECCTGIVCACLPTMMPLVEKYRINTIGSRFLSMFRRSTGSRSTSLKTDNSKRHLKDSRPREHKPQMQESILEQPFQYQPREGYI